MKVSLFAACALLAASAAAGADNIPATLAGCLEQGLRASPVLRAARLAQMSAAAALGEARAARLPALVLTGSAARVNDEPASSIGTPLGPITLGPWIEDRASLGASLKQNLFSGFAVSARIQSAAAAGEAAAADFAAEVSRGAYEIEAAWWSLAAALDARAVVEESQRLLRIHLTEAQAFLAQGLATREELLAVTSEVAQADLRVIEAASTERVARSRLALLIGLGHDATGGPAPAPVAPEAPGPQSGASLDSLVAKALAARPELSAMDDRIRASAAAVGAAASGFYPSVSLDGSFVWARPNPLLFPPKDQFDATWQIGVTASVNVGGYAAVAERTRGAALDTERLRAQRAARAMQVAMEVTESYEAVSRATERIASATAAIARSQEGLRVVGDKRAAGLARATDLLDAELDLTRARLDGSRASADLRIGLAALRLAVGEPAPGTAP